MGLGSNPDRYRWKQLELVEPIVRSPSVVSGNNYRHFILYTQLKRDNDDMNLKSCMLFVDHRLMNMNIGLSIAARDRWHKASRNLDIFSIGWVESSNWPIIRCNYEIVFTYLTD